MRIFLIICFLIIPVTMIFFGVLWQKRPPKEISHTYGYRTRRSMASREAWDYAHRTFGRWWRNLGIAILPLTGAAMFFYPRHPDVAYGLCGVQLLALVIPIPFFERHLKKKFGK